MSDDTHKDKNERRPLTLKSGNRSGEVKQRFTKGRSKTIIVEKRRRRVISPIISAGDKDKTTNTVNSQLDFEKDKEINIKNDETVNSLQVDTGNLSQEEIKARQAVIEKARKDSEQRNIKKAQEIAVLDKKMAKEVKELENVRLAEIAKIENAKQAKQEVQFEKKYVSSDKTKSQGKSYTKNQKEEVVTKDKYNSENRAFEVNEKDNPLARLGGRIKTKSHFTKDTTASKDNNSRRTGKLTITNALDDEERQRSLASLKRSREKEKLSRQKNTFDVQKRVREIIIPDTITVQELSSRLAVRSVDLIKELMKMGQMVTNNALIDADTATLIVEELGHTVKRESDLDIEENLYITKDNVPLLTRPPVVTIMGHVDHGKTSLLDALRSTNVVASESGGITQHIGAYQITTKDGIKISFLDTPGHAAFTQMRARGANATDIVVIVVAANDGIMPQTIEAIAHAKAAKVPIIIAVNKIDLPDADPTKTINDLLQHEIQCESIGGDVQDIQISALKKKNLDELISAIILQSELLELSVAYDQNARGVVVEAKLEKNKGPQATFLVQEGTLKSGDVFIVGESWGRIKAMTDDNKRSIKQAQPSLPVEILGLSDIPNPGDEFIVVESEKRAKEVSLYRKNKNKELKFSGRSGVSLEQMMSKIQDKKVKELNIILKADVQGSLEAIISTLKGLDSDEVVVNILHQGVGGITQSDLVLAGATNSSVFGFNVRASGAVKNQADKEKIEIRYYSVIYDLIDDIKDTVSGMLDPELKENFIGNAKIIELFSISKFGMVAGCLVKDGHVKKGAQVRLIRDDVVIHEGELSQLKRFKDDVNEVRAGQECGMSFAKYDNLKVDDVIECFEVTKIARKI